jgi:hypothetical protein
MANQPNKVGATITEKLDLIDKGFAWNKDIKKEATFQDMVNDMKFKI